MTSFYIVGSTACVVGICIGQQMYCKQCRLGAKSRDTGGKTGGKVAAADQNTILSKLGDQNTILSKL